MKRRTLIAGAVGAAVVPKSWLVGAQQPRSRRIALFGASSPTPEVLRASVDPFRDGMRRNGWTEGSGYALEIRWAEGRAERYGQLADELVKLAPEVIVTSLGAQVAALKQATSTIPIVMVAATDPIDFGLIASYARPGGNVTGLSTDAGQTIIIKQLDLLRQTVPGLARVGIMSNAANPSVPRLLKDLEPAARSMKVELVPASIRTAEDFEPAFARLKKQQAQGLLVVVDGLFVIEAARVGALATTHRLPTASGWPGIAQAGGLLSYATDLADLYRRAAGYVDKILKGAKAGDLPVEQPVRFEFIVNRKAAQSLGLTLPQLVLAGADRVIE